MENKSTRKPISFHIYLILGSLFLAFIGLFFLAFLSSLFAFETINSVLIFTVFVALLVLPSIYYYYGSIGTIVWEFRIWIAFFSFMLLSTLFREILGFYEMIFWILILLGAIGIYLNMHPHIEKKLKTKK